MLSGKKIVVGVCGGIAVYKAVELISLLRKAGAEVTVIMTQNAKEFVSKLTFETISQNRVYDEMFQDIGHWEVEHISLAKEKDLFVLIPATANVIGKIASGIADDMLTTTVMATKSKVLIAPAMNTNMYTNPIVVSNIGKLKKWGYYFVEPATGNLACGDVGIGKLAPIETIYEEILNQIAFEKDMTGIKVLVTAGPTKEYIDPVRFISNDSSGKMGYAVAQTAKYRGADVTLISGETHLPKIPGIQAIDIISADDMYEQVIKIADQFDIIVKAAAVSDFKVKNQSDQKIKKETFQSLETEKNRDILKAVSIVNKKAAIVGFCMETQNLLESAKKKLEFKNADLIVANNLKTEGAGFKTDTNVVKIIDRSLKVFDIPKMKKTELAGIILDRALNCFYQKNGGKS